MNKNIKVAVGVSGGADSTYAIYKLLSQGYHVIGITMNLYDTREDYPSFIDDAKKVSDYFNIEHYVLDLREEFRSMVIEPFINAYKNGLTPNPCALCNPTIKYGKLLDYALSLGADYLATGHYAHIEYDNKLKRYILMQSSNSRKDQSYLLYSLSQHQLSKIMLPLYEENEKSHIFSTVESFLPHISRKRESWGICFTKGLSPEEYIKNALPNSMKPGNIVDIKGNILGNHNGLLHYTLGQKKGLGINKYTVVDLDIKTNTLVVSTNDIDCYKNGVYIDSVNIIPYSHIPDEIRATVKLCQWGYVIPARICFERDSKEKSLKGAVYFHKPERAPAKGQICVIYDGDMVIGGGIITELF